MTETLLDPTSELSSAKREPLPALNSLTGKTIGLLDINKPRGDVLLVVNVAFGVMSRSAPQMNIFAVGFPITLIFGLMIMWVGFSAFLSSFEDYVNQGFNFAMNLLENN